MSQDIDFYFDFNSVHCYVAWERLLKLTQSHNAKIKLIPTPLHELLRSSGCQDPLTVSAKAQYLKRDLGRYANKHRVNISRTATAPNQTEALLSIAQQAIDHQQGEEVVTALYRAIWDRPVNLDSHSAIMELLASKGLATDIYIKGSSAQIKQNLSNALELGAFSLPTFFANGEMLFGQDRIWVIEELLGSTSPF